MNEGACAAAAGCVGAALAVAARVRPSGVGLIAEPGRGSARLGATNAGSADIGAGAGAGAYVVGAGVYVMGAGAIS